MNKWTKTEISRLFHTIFAQLREQLEVQTTTPNVGGLATDISELRTQVTGQSMLGLHAGQELSRSSGIRTGATEFRVFFDLNKGMKRI